jgi:hypothetical protein
MSNRAKSDQISIQGGKMNNTKKALAVKTGVRAGAMQQRPGMQGARAAE